MTKVKFQRVEDGPVEVIECEHAHVRDACLVFAEKGKRGETRHIPVGGLWEFTIVQEAAVVGSAPVYGTGETAVHAGRPVPRGLENLVGKAADRTVR